MISDSTIARDERPNFEAFAIVEKYEVFLNYLYPKVQNCPRRHGVVRDQVLNAMLGVVPALYAAGKSKQVSRLYLIDADLATLRFWLRFMDNDARRIINHQQQRTALAQLDQVGRMLGAWIAKLSPRQAGQKETGAPARSLG